MPPASGSQPFMAQDFVEAAAVGDTGQAVYGVEPLKLAIGLVQLSGQLDQRVTHLGDAAHGIHLGAQHDLGNRLDQVVVAARFDALREVHVIGAGRQEDDRGPFNAPLLLADASRHIKAVEVRHDHIKQY
jgi:hypothetical protein